MFPVRKSLIVLLSICQFNELFYGLDPNNSVFFEEKSTASRKEERREGVGGKEINSSLLGLPSKILHRFFFPHSDNLLTLSYAASDCNYFGLLG